MMEYKLTMAEKAKIRVKTLFDIATDKSFSYEAFKGLSAPFRILGTLDKVYSHSKRLEDLSNNLMRELEHGFECGNSCRSMENTQASAAALSRPWPLIFS